MSFLTQIMQRNMAILQGNNSSANILQRNQSRTDLLGANLSTATLAAADTSCELSNAIDATNMAIADATIKNTEENLKKQIAEAFSYNFV